MICGVGGVQIENVMILDARFKLRNSSQVEARALFRIGRNGPCVVATLIHRMKLGFVVHLILEILHSHQMKKKETCLARLRRPCVL